MQSELFDEIEDEIAENLRRMEDEFIFSVNGGISDVRKKIIKVISEVWPDEFELVLSCDDDLK